VPALALALAACARPATAPAARLDGGPDGVHDGVHDGAPAHVPAASASRPAPPHAPCTGPGCLPSFRAATIDGAPLGSDELAGKVALVMFWASWCEPCISEGPSIDQVYRRHRDDGFVIVGMSLDEVDDATLRRFRDAYHITYPIVRAGDALFKVFGSPPEVPTFLLYGRGGRQRWRGTGALPAEILEREVTHALTAPATDRPVSRALSIVVARRLDDPDRVAAVLAERRKRGPTVAILAAERVDASARVVNGLRFDAWATRTGLLGVTAPAVVQDVPGSGRRSYAIAQVDGYRVAVVGRGDAAAMARAADLARADGQATLVVTLGHASGDVDVPQRGPPLESIELQLDGAGKIVTSERRALPPTP